MSLWITIVEAIFRKRGRAQQTKVNTWLTDTSPQRNWRDKYKDTMADSTTQYTGLEDGSGGGVPDP